LVACVTEFSPFFPLPVRLGHPLPSFPHPPRSNYLSFEPITVGGKSKAFSPSFGPPFFRPRVPLLSAPLLLPPSVPPLGSPQSFFFDAPFFFHSNPFLRIDGSAWPPPAPILQTPNTPCTTYSAPPHVFRPGGHGPYFPPPDFSTTVPSPPKGSFSRPFSSVPLSFQTLFRAFLPRADPFFPRTDSFSRNLRATFFHGTNSDLRVVFLCLSEKWGFP